ncbi:Unknown protein sequence [Pseudomonas syringae pv. cilantro]|uniref:Uncharacterized protein n=2 Tax=Pseudomonas syringae group TaxID=136849 RepID=A0A0N0XAG2_PSESX|nr:Unknown protein sequence [Pseudomonas syringae pv. cilantro]KPW72962.1 Unknown protein sequence [Pseudomonas syringae pv. coriandricola]RMN14401.1 hypothetical protein ALQ65_04116 [Pseudomonas syringae pv. coriandricola]
MAVTEATIMGSKTNSSKAVSALGYLGLAFLAAAGLLLYSLA